jgi:hypothetical protein
MKQIVQGHILTARNRLSAALRGFEFVGFRVNDWDTAHAVTRCHVLAERLAHQL